MTTRNLIRFKASDHLVFDLVDKDSAIVRALGHKAIFELLKQCLDTPRFHARFLTVEFPAKAVKEGSLQRILGVEVDFQDHKVLEEPTFKWSKDLNTRALEGTGLRSGCTCLGYQTAKGMIEQIARVCVAGDEFQVTVNPGPADVKPSKSGRVPSLYKLQLINQE